MASSLSSSSSPKHAALQTAWRDFCARHQAGSSSSYLRLSSLILDRAGLALLINDLNAISWRPASFCLDHVYFDQENDSDNDDDSDQENGRPRRPRPRQPVIGQSLLETPLPPRQNRVLTQLWKTLLGNHNRNGNNNNNNDSSTNSQGLQHLRLWGPTSHLALAALVESMIQKEGEEGQRQHSDWIPTRQHQQLQHGNTNLNQTTGHHIPLPTTTMTTHVTAARLQTFHLCDISFQGHHKGELLRALLTNCRNSLQHLEFQRCYMDVEAVRPLAEGLRGMTATTRKSSQDGNGDDMNNDSNNNINNPTRTASSSLESFSFWNSFLTDAMLQILVEVGFTNNTTTTTTIENNTAEEAAASSNHTLASTPPHPPIHANLRKLVLRTNSLSRHSLPALTQLVQALPQLENLDIAYNRQLLDNDTNIAQDDNDNNNDTTTRTNHDSLTAAARLQQFFDAAFGSHPSLQRCQLRLCGLDAPGANALLRSLAKPSCQLHELDLGGNLQMCPEQNDNDSESRNNNNNNQQAPLCWIPRLAQLHSLQELILPRAAGQAIPIDVLRQNTSLIDLRFDNPTWNLVANHASDTSCISNSSLIMKPIRPILRRNQMLLLANKVIQQERKRQRRQHDQQQTASSSSCRQEEAREQQQPSFLSSWPHALESLSGREGEGSSAIYAVMQSVVAEQVLS